MKRNLMTIVSLMTLATMMAFTSCTKEEATGNGSQFRATMEGCNAAKTELNGTALEWVGGDRIAVYGTGGAGIYSATPQTPATVAVFDNVSGETGDGPFRAFYPATLTTDGVNITLPSTQTYVEGSINEFPMYAESSDNQLAFKNLCGVLKLHLTKANTNISSITVTANAEINGTFSVNYNSGDPELTYSANGTNTTTLTCATAQSIAEGKDFYIYLPEGSYSGLQIELNTDDGRYCVKTANTAINVTRSQYTLITLGSTLQFRPVGSKGGLFTINADGDQVWFSQGNLQYQASTGTWRFAEHQWDYVGTQTPGGYGRYGGTVCGSDNRNISSTYTGWIDLFGWGTSGWNSGAVYYQPWSTNGGNFSYFPGGSYTNCLTGDYAEADWAWHNTISNGGNAVHQWRTLTSVEWDYLLKNRYDASAKCGTGNIDGVGGLIILPDSWTLPSGCTFISGLASNDWTDNSYNLDEWARMESAGAVFLPAAGHRNYINVNSVGYTGLYWSTTPDPDSYAATGMDFYSNYLCTPFYSFRGDGLSVRPVQDEE